MTWLTEQFDRIWEALKTGIAWIGDTIASIIAALWSVLRAAIDLALDFLLVIVTWVLDGLWAIPSYLWERMGGQVTTWLTNLYAYLDSTGWVPPFDDLLGHLSSLQTFWSEINYFVPLDGILGVWVSAMTVIYHIRVIKFGLRMGWRLSPFGWFGATAS